MTDARAMMDFATPKYKSKAEERWASLGRALIESDLMVKVAIWHYEPMSFRIPGGRYTPDFMYVMSDGLIAFVEVKGSKKQRGYRDARSKIRAAAGVYPYFRWYMATSDESFVLERI